MPFDPNLEPVETKPAIETNPHPVFSLDGLIWWLERQPGEDTYDWTDCSGACAIGLYFRDSGIKWSAANYREMIPIIIGRDGRTNSSVLLSRPWTFGAALSRAKALRAAARQP